MLYKLLLFCFLSFQVESCSFAQDSVDLLELISKTHYYCPGQENCCRKGMALGERPLPLLFKKAIFNKDSNDLRVEGVIDLSKEFTKILAAVFLGESMSEKICPVRSLCTVNEITGGFSFTVRLTNNNNVLCIQKVGYELVVIKVGELYNK